MVGSFRTCDKMSDCVCGPLLECNLIPQVSLDLVVEYYSGFAFQQMGIGICSKTYYFSSPGNGQVYSDHSGLGVSVQVHDMGRA